MSHRSLCKFDMYLFQSSIMLRCWIFWKELFSGFGIAVNFSIFRCRVHCVSWHHSTVFRLFHSSQEIIFNVTWKEHETTSINNLNGFSHTIAASNQKVEIRLLHVTLVAWFTESLVRETRTFGFQDTIALGETHLHCHYCSQRKLHSESAKHLRSR